MRSLPKLAFALVFIAGCRNGTAPTTPTFRVQPNDAGMNGCSGPNQTFTAPQVPTPIPLATLVVGPSSQITSVATSELLYATGANGQVVSIDVTGGTPVETELLPAGSGTGTVTDLLAAHGIAKAPDLSGIALLDSSLLVLVERSSNTLLSVQLNSGSATVDFFAGQPNETGGFGDGNALGTNGLARFSFDHPTQICPTGDTPPSVFVADPGNHAIRVVAGNSVITVGGTGIPGYDAHLPHAQFDTPTGLSASCDGSLIVSELGGNGAGHRIREIAIGAALASGGFSGTANAIAGDGTAASTSGRGTLAQVDAPVSPLVTSLGEAMWIDSGTGVLRRQLVDGAVDCPMDVDCATAVGAPSFPAGHAFSLTQTPAGVLYVLDATAGILYRVTP